MWIYFHSSTCRDLFRPAPFVEDVFFPPLVCMCGFIVKSQVSIGLWTYVWVFRSSIDQGVCCYAIPCCFNYCRSAVLFEVRVSDTSRSFIILDQFTIWCVCVCFYMNLNIILSVSVKNRVGILKGMVLTLSVDCFW